MIFHIPHPLAVGKIRGRGVWGETTCPPKYDLILIHFDTPSACGGEFHSGKIIALW